MVRNQHKVLPQTLLLRHKHQTLLVLQMHSLQLRQILQHRLIQMLLLQQILIHLHRLPLQQMVALPMVKQLHKRKLLNLASRAEELQSTTTPLTFLAMGSLFAAVNTGGDPSGPIAEVATFVPFSAPMVLPIRIAAGEVGLGTVAVSVGIVLLSIVAAMKLAARVYAGGALHLRGQLGLRKALRSG